MDTTPIPWCNTPGDLPNTQLALQAPLGLLAASLQINADWLEESYSRGIFPWYSEDGPVLWWSPSPRAVLYTSEFKLHHSLFKAVRKIQKDPSRTIRINTAFKEVIHACAQPRNGQNNNTWITQDVTSAYVQLHRRGLAHCIEHWHKDELVGGLYCVALGRMIFGESMFSIQTDASKVAFAYFVYWLKAQNVHIIDCQQATQHLMSMGARAINRETFEFELTNAIAQPGLKWEPRELTWMYDKD